MLAQRAVSEDPRWTRAVGDSTRPPPNEGERYIEKTIVAHCSRSAHDQNVLARRAQWDHHEYPSIKREVEKSLANNKMHAVRDQSSPPCEREN